MGVAAFGGFGGGRSGGVPGFAGDDGGVLWGGDYGEYMGWGVERVGEAACVGLWGGERWNGGGDNGGCYGRSALGEGMGEAGLCEVRGEEEVM